MYNDSYINDFEEKYYKQHLNNTKYLDELKDKYLSQYSSQSDAQYLAFKESLDHYIYKQIVKNNDYINSAEFKNYLNYIMHVVNDKKTSLNNQNFNLELSTNIIFRDDSIRNIIFKKYYNESTIDIFESHIKETKKKLSEINNKMLKREYINQEELDFISDYIYSSRNFIDNTDTYIEYIFNEIIPDSNIKASTQILGAITYCFTQEYTKDPEVKNSRTFIADRDNKSSDLAHKSGNRKYCYFNRKYFSNLSLIDDNSLNKSRTFDDNDLYFLMMVSFHELTHEYQHNEVRINSSSSSALANIIKDVLNQNLDGFSGLDKDGNIVNVSEYKVNHDSTEYEIQADEESWRQCAHFISKHCRNYAYKNKLSSSIASLREQKCLINERIINARRTFSLKKENDGSKIYYALYDIKNLCKIVHDNPNILEQYPVLKQYFKQDGCLKAEIMFSNNITSSDSTGLDVDNSNLQFATYILDYDKNSILEELKKCHCNELQIKNLVINIYNVMHQNVLKIRNLEKVNISNYNQTQHNFNLNDDVDTIYNYFFTKNANEVYNALEILYTIHKCYPNIDLSHYNDTKYYASYFYELLSKIKNIDLKNIQNICNKYDNSKAPFLIELSNYMKANILNKKDSNYSVINDMISQMVNGQLDTNGQPIVPEGQQMTSSRKMGFINVKMLGIIATIISIVAIVSFIIINLK